jgi:predicted 2-oxoglutarate/Fe(II)-dependent dioxygenase YbiX
MFFLEKFLDPELCDEICSQVRSAKPMRATVKRQDWDAEDEVNTTQRRTLCADMPADTVGLVQRPLSEVRPVLAKHFGLTLSHCEPLQFLFYKEGDFYGPHFDSKSDGDDARPDEDRRVSIILFLNSGGAEAEKSSYSGGALKFYGLIDDPAFSQYGFPLMGEAGLLVAFRSNTVHEVTPVTRGERFTVATWFY